MNTSQTEEYFLKKFDAKSPIAKSRAIFDCFSAYSSAQNLSALAKSRKRLDKLDDTAEINFRLACKQLKLLSTEELTIFLHFVREKMVSDFLSAKEEQKLNARLEYSRILRLLPEVLTPDQQALKNEMLDMIENYYIKDDKQM